METVRKYLNLFEFSGMGTLLRNTIQMLFRVLKNKEESRPEWQCSKPKQNVMSALARVKRYNDEEL